MLVTWLPERYAVKDKWVKLKDKNGNWDNGWQVVNIWSKEQAKIIEQRERDFIHQREMSDI